ncbi:17043_t:CDS:1, partial [Racocetra persica]
GIEGYDTTRKEFFTLHAIVVNWSSDIPGLTKIMCLTRHNSYRGCRYCNLKGVCTNHIYYPTTPPTDVNTMRYCASNLPSRTHEKWKERLKKIRDAKSEKER